MLDTPGPLSDDGLVQLLNPAGKRVSHPRFDAYAADLDDAALLALYRDMVLTRRFDREATALQRTGELALFAPAEGQEGAQIGSAHALAPHDHVFPSYREHGVGLVRGVDPVDLLRLFRGVDHGGWDPRPASTSPATGHGFHLYTLVVGAHTLHAVGYAMGMARDRAGLTDGTADGSADGSADGAVVAYFGDGATSQGDVSEALVFAAVNAAPVVFFCQNNQWAISVPTTRQAVVPIADRAPGFGIPGVRVDGNDPLACYAVTRWALERARAGGGPTFVEALTYRMGAHTTSDDPSRYHDPAVERRWRERDPLDRMRTYLALDEATLAAVDAEAEALATRLRAGVQALRGPDPAAVYDHVYATEHAQVTAGRATVAGGAR